VYVKFLVLRSATVTAGNEIDGAFTASLMVKSSDNKFGTFVCNSATGGTLPVEFNPDWGQF
jgi:hypothetical protein